MKNILIIEDDVVFSRSISNWLKKKGMATAHVATLVRNFRLRSSILSWQTCACRTVAVWSC